MSTQIRVKLMYAICMLFAYNSLHAQSNELGFYSRLGVNKTDIGAPYPVFDTGVEYTRFITPKIGISIGGLYGERYNQQVLNTVYEDLISIPIRAQFRKQSTNSNADFRFSVGLEYSYLISQRKVSTLTNESQTFNFGSYSKLSSTFAVEAGIYISSNTRLGLGVRFVTDGRVISQSNPNVIPSLYKSMFLNLGLSSSF